MMFSYRPYAVTNIFISPLSNPPMLFEFHTRLKIALRHYALILR